MKESIRKLARTKIHNGLILLSVAWLWTGCTATPAQLARIGFPGVADIQLHDIRLARSGINNQDSIVFVTDEKAPSNAWLNDDKIASCTSDAFKASKNPTVRLITLDDFRRAAFRDLDPNQLLTESWNKLLNDAEVQRRLMLFNFRYLIALTVNQDKSLTRADLAGWSWQRNFTVSGKIVDLKNIRVAGKVTASVSNTSAAGVLPTVIPFANPSFVEARACAEFGHALVKFLTSDEQPPKIIMTNLTLDNLFTHHQEHRESPQNIHAANDGNRLGRTSAETVNQAAPMISPAPVANHQIISIEQSKTFDELKVAALKRVGIHATAFVTKEAVDYENGEHRWPSQGAGSQNAICQEIKASLKTLIINNDALPPLPSRWHFGVVWIAKMFALPIQIMIPITAILAAPISPHAAVWGIETLHNCV